MAIQNVVRMYTAGRSRTLAVFLSVIVKINPPLRYFGLGTDLLKTYSVKPHWDE
jgi:hypothetical protein